MPKQKSNDFLKNVNKILDMFESKNYQKALKKINTLLNKKYETDLLLILKGSVLTRLGELQKSKKILRYVLKKKLDKNLLVMASIDYGEVLLNTGRYKESIKNLDNALKSDPENHTALEYKARVQMSLKKYREAIKNFKKAYEINPICISCSANMAICYANMKNFNESLKILKKLHEQNKSDIRILKLIFSIYYKRNDLIMADKYIDIILKLEDTDFVPYSYKAEISKKLYKYETASIYYKKTINLLKQKNCKHCTKLNFPKLAFEYGNILIKMRKYNDALILVKDGLKISRNKTSLLKLKSKINKLKNET